MDQGLIWLETNFSSASFSGKKYFGDALHLNKLDVINACSF